eukprot:343644-Pelagomonas_calceolata.AAC.2
MGEVACRASDRYSMFTVGFMALLGQDTVVRAVVTGKLAVKDTSVVQLQKKSAPCAYIPSLPTTWIVSKQSNVGLRMLEAEDCRPSRSQAMPCRAPRLVLPLRMHLTQSSSFPCRLMASAQADLILAMSKHSPHHAEFKHSPMVLLRLWLSLAS